MRYLYAAIALLLGLVLLGLGVGQLNAGNEETLTAETEGAQEAPFTVVTDDIVDADAGRDEFTIEAEGEYALAVGRTYDIESWLGEAAYNRVTGFVEAADDQPSRIDVEYVDGDSQAPSPEDSDLWAATESAEGDLLYRWSTPDDTGDWALLIFRDGEEPAPAAITIEETDTTSQAAGIALLIGGGLVTLLALGLFYWASRSRRQSQGPDDDESSSTTDREAAMTESSAAESISDTTTNPQGSNSSGRTDFTSGGRSAFSTLTAVVLAAASAVGVAGPAHADQEPSPDGDGDQAEQPDEAEAPDAEDLEDEGDVEVEEEIPAEGYSMLLSSQLERILTDIAATVEAGDAEQDTELIEGRVGGDALNAREVAYRNHTVAEAELPTPIGTEVLSAAVTSDQDFPRQAMVITDHPDSDVPQILVLEQESPRENYRLIHTSVMAPGTEFPSLSAEQGGTEPVDQEREINGHNPGETVAGLAGYFTDSEHDYGADIADSVYIDSLHQYYEDLAEAADDTEVSFPDPEPRENVTALQLPDDSTVVAGSFEMVMQMAPLQDGDTIFLEHDLVVELVGTDWTTFPTEIFTLESVVLHLPPEGSDEDAVLLGVHDIIEDASIDTPEWFDGYDDD